jgi:hypothetical protein
VIRMRRTPWLVVPVMSCSLGLVAPPARADEAACIAASEDALTLRQQGKLHDALKKLAVCAEATCSSEVKAECAQRIAAIDAAMPTLVLGAKDGAGNDLYDVHVSMDATPLTSSLDGRPIALDPGEHTFTFETAGNAPVEKKLVLREGEKDRHESVEIGPVPTPAVVAPVAVSLPPPAPSPPPWGPQKTLAVVSGGVGVVGIGLGIWFGAFASSSQSKEKTDCPATGCLNRAQAVEDYDTARKDATGSTIAFIAGGTLLAAGAVLWLSAPKDHGPPGAAQVHLAPVVDGRSGRFALGGSF